MRKGIGLVLAFSAACLTAPVFVADALADCYRQADSKVEVQACLKKELAQVEKDYQDVVGRVLTNARDLDRIQKRKGAAKAFEDSNKAFMRYVETECNWVEESYGAGTGAGNAVLACRINLLRMRTGSLDAQFLSASK